MSVEEFKPNKVSEVHASLEEARKQAEGIEMSQDRFAEVGYLVREWEKAEPAGTRILGAEIFDEQNNADTDTAARIAQEMSTEEEQVSPEELIDWVRLNRLKAAEEDAARHEDRPLEE